jgi:hypothetical protein
MKPACKALARVIYYRREEGLTAKADLELLCGRSGAALKLSGTPIE